MTSTVHALNAELSPVFDIRPARAEDVSIYWPLIRVALLGIKADQGPRATWTPEHVLHTVMQGRAELWLALDGAQLAAFMVIQPLVDAFLNVPTGIFVWMAWRHPKADPQVIERFDETLVTLAKVRGLLYIEAITTWPRFAKRLERLGWETVMYVTRKDVH